MAISKNYTYKCVDCSRHNRIMGAKALMCILSAHTVSQGYIDSVVSRVIHTLVCTNMQHVTDQNNI